MSQEQPRRRQEPIKYGEVFNVSGELASKPIAPRDAATMQSVESQALGQTQKGGPAALMESAAAINERAGVASHDAATNVARNEGVSISETNELGNRAITETVGGQVVGQYVQPDEAKRNWRSGGGGDDVNELGVPASMQPPGVRAAEENDFISEDGVAALSGASLNPRFVRNEDKNNTLSHVSSDKRETGEGADNIITGIPGGMGASMATADHRVKKNK